MSGKKNKKVEVSMKGEISSHDYTNHHVKSGCDGTWGIMHSNSVPYPIDVLGTVLLPIVPFIACPKCEAAYLMPGFLELVQKTIASHLVVSDKVLSAKEIRFLRLTFGLTQQGVVDAIDMESTSYYSKCETGKEPFGSDKQVRIKLLYATKLGINQAEDYHKISLTSLRRESNETNSVLNLKSFFPQEKINQLSNQFKIEHHLKDIPSSKFA